MQPEECFQWYNNKRSWEHPGPFQTISALDMMAFLKHLEITGRSSDGLNISVNTSAHWPAHNFSHECCPSAFPGVKSGIKPSLKVLESAGSWCGYLAWFTSLEVVELEASQWLHLCDSTQDTPLVVRDLLVIFNTLLVAPLGLPGDLLYVVSEPLVPLVQLYSMRSLVYQFDSNIFLVWELLVRRCMGRGFI